MIKNYLISKTIINETSEYKCEKNNKRQKFKDFFKNTVKFQDITVRDHLIAIDILAK